MLTLFYKPTCPFCQRVLGEVEDVGVKINLKNISTDTVALDELVERGGKKQTPFLEDTDRGVTMYESGDIIAYLQEHYKTNSTSSMNVCESCQ